MARFTPTCVGNCPLFWIDQLKLSVHPHVCGELELRRLVDVVLIRFTPTCVGNCHFSCSIFDVTERFTPTCVGNWRSRFGSASVLNGSPPRVWGIDERVTGYSALYFGSPPRVWGIERSSFNNRLIKRFTPTCVGNCPKSSPEPIVHSVHPHVCGELLASCRR